MSIFAGLFRNFRRAPWTETEEAPGLVLTQNINDWNDTADKLGFENIIPCDATSLGGFRPGICPWTKCVFKAEDTTVTFAEHNLHEGIDIFLSDHQNLQPRLKKAIFNGVIRVAKDRLCFVFKDYSLFGVFADLARKRCIGHFDLSEIELKGRLSPGMVVTQCEVSSDWQFAAIVCQTSTKGTLMRRQHYHTPSTYTIYVMKCSTIGDQHKVSFDCVLHTLRNVASCSLYGLRFSFVPAFSTQRYVLTNLAQSMDSSDKQVTHLAVFDLHTNSAVGALPNLHLQEPQKLWRIQNLVYAKDGAVLILCLESAHEAFNKKARYLLIDMNRITVLRVISHDLLIDYWRTVNCMQCYINTYPSVSRNGHQVAVLCTQIEECPVDDCDDTREEAVQCVKVYQIPNTFMPLQSICKITIISSMSTDSMEFLPLPKKLKVYLGMVPS